MAVILEFRASECEVPRPPRARTSGPAEIVIFPGVRYERQPEREQRRERRREPIASVPIRDVLKLLD